MSDLYKTKLPINNFVIWAIEMKPYIKKHYNHFSIEEKKNVLRKLWSTISNSTQKLYTKKAVDLRLKYLFYETLLEFREKYNIQHPMLEETQPILYSQKLMLHPQSSMLYPQELILYPQEPILLPPIIINDIILYTHSFLDKSYFKNNQHYLEYIENNL